MLGPMLTQFLGQSMLEGPKQFIQTAKTRIIFAALALVVGIVALIFIAFAGYLWLAQTHTALDAAGIIAAVLIALTAGCAAVVCWPPNKALQAPPPAPPPPEAEAVLAIEQLSRSMGELGRGKNGGLAMLGILAGVAAVGFGLGRKN
ncbi:MAG: hypothetical protein ACK4NA_14630 [Alphaproteobacteria bacterium]